MADNSQAGAAVGIGDVFASDDIGGVKWPRAKIAWGIDGVAADASAANPLPVVQTGTPALPTGAATETTLAAASAKLPATLGQKAMAASMAVVLASDQSSVPVAATLTAETTKVIGTVNIAAAQTIAVTNAGTFAAQVAGTKTNNNAAPGATNVGVLPSVATAAAPSSTEGNQVAISMNLLGDQRCISKVTDGTTTAGVIAGTTALKTDLSSVAGTATVTSAAGVQRVGIAGNANAALDSATGSAVPANALLTGVRVATSNPSNAASGNNAAAMADKAGRQVVTIGHIRELIGVQQTATSLNTEVTIVTAGGAGVFNDISQLIITTAGAAAATLTIKDATAGTTRMVLNYPNAAVAPGTPLVINFNPPLPQAAANANWTITNSVATAINVTAVFLKNL